jgi:hypothetical protein
MSKARKNVEYFNKSTQQTSKLLNFQKESNLAIYSGHGFFAKKVLQDVITRWWLSYCMLKHLRFLKPALMCLYAAKEITCDMLDYDQWVVLEQIEITLKKIGMFQRTTVKNNSITLTRVGRHPHDGNAVVQTCQQPRR